MENVSESISYKKRKENEYKDNYKRIKKDFKRNLFDTGISSANKIYADDLFRDILEEENLFIYWYPHNKYEYITYLGNYKTYNIIDNITISRKFGIPMVLIVVFIVCVLTDHSLSISLKLIIGYLFLSLLAIFSFYMTTDILKIILIYRVNKKEALRLGKFSLDMVDELIKKGETVYFVEKENRYIISKY